MCVCVDWNPTPADMYRTLPILAINKYHALPFDFLSLAKPHPCVSFFTSFEAKVSEMEMLLDRIFLGYDGKKSGLQAILEPLCPALKDPPAMFFTIRGFRNL